MNWDSFQLLDAATRAQTLTQLAQQLGVDPTTASRRMRQIEEQLGLSLFVRTRGKLLLTPHAQHLVQRIEPMSAAASQVLQEARALQDTPEGTVAVSAPPTLIRHVIAEAIGDLAEKAPKITVDLTLERTNVRLDKVEADIAIRMGRPSDTAAHILMRRVGTLPYAVYKPAAYKTNRWIAYPTAFDHVPEAAWVNKQLAGDAPIMRSNDPDVMAAAVAKGVGIALLAVPVGASAGSSLQRGDTVLQKEVFVLRRPERGRRSATTVVHEWLVNALKDSLVAM